MSKRRVYNVNPTNNGDWEVKEKGADRSVKVYEDKSAAIDRAKELAKIPALGQVVVRKADGKIQTEYTYGADPTNRKG
jgi:hypothetical protein